MAKQPIVEHYHENSGSFKTLSSSLRKVSSDKSVPKGQYVGLYQDVVDMIKGDKGVENIGYDKKSNTLIIVTKDGEKSNIRLEDNYLDKASYDPKKKNIELTLNNGEKMQVNVSQLENKFYNKTETYTKTEANKVINKIVQENRNPIWGTF